MLDKNGGFIMAKIIKRAGMIFFVSVISCLIALGCVITMQVTESSNNGIVNADTQNNIYTSQNNEDSSYTVPKAEVPEVPKSDYEYELGHKANCTNQTTCTCMQDIWNSAVQKSLDTGKNVKVTLLNDWIASTDDAMHKLGTGIGFVSQDGTLHIPLNAEITLDLNGHDIDRKFDASNAIPGGLIFRFQGTLNLVDNKYNTVEIENIYNQTKGNKDNFVSALNNYKAGQIRGGGRSENSGGAIVLDPGAVLNMYGGIITENYAFVSGGAICSTNGTKVNIYDGVITNNYSNRVGGLFIQDDIDIYGGIIAYNHDLIEENVVNQAGGMYVISPTADVNIYGGKITHNTSTGRAGGVYFHNANKVNIYDCDISYNQAGSYGGGIYSRTVNEFNFYNGKVNYNTTEADGGGMILYLTKVVRIYDGQINNNTASYGGGIKIDSVEDAYLYGGEISGNVGDNGGGIYVNCRLYLKGGTIVNNIAENGGGIYVAGKVSLGAGTQVYGNKLKTNAESDILLHNGTKLQIFEKLGTDSKTTRVGVALASDYGSGYFTSGYKYFNESATSISPSVYFFSNASNTSVVLDGEDLKMSTGTKPTATCDWIISNKGTEERFNKDNVIRKTYNGSIFTISNSKGAFYIGGSYNTSINSYTQALNVGEYAFYTKENVTNPVFTLIIEPKQVDLEWQTILTYNGTVQSPIANVAENEILNLDSCNVLVDGSAINVGTNYYATAISLQNINYKINPLTKSTTYKILPAELEINISTNDKSAVYSGQEIKLDKWFSVSATLLGNDKLKPLTNVFNIDYSKIVPQFTKDGITTDSVINVEEYAISVKPFDVSKVFSGNSNYNVTVNYVNGGTLTVSEANVIRPTAESKYDYLILEGDKRVSYKDKGLIHGDNDSNVNVVDGKANYYMGNISPNTSVNKFISNLVYEKTQIQIYNSKGTIIYDKGNASVNEELLNNGKELEVGTGWYIEYSKDGETERITLSVLGDVNGDGRISASDVTYLRQIASDNALYESLSVEKKLASMVINKGNVTSADAEIVRNVVDKLLTMNLFF